MLTKLSHTNPSHYVKVALIVLHRLDHLGFTQER